MAVLTNPITAKNGISVDMAEIKVSTRLTDRLIAYGLGACIGLCVYDPVLHIAGLAHIVLPAKQPTTKSAPGLFAGKYADIAVPQLIQDICRSGGDRNNLLAAIVGGAHIFSAVGSTSAPSRLEIGARNIAAVTELLKRQGIPIVAEDVGGSHGRTVTIQSWDGQVLVQPIGAEESLLTTLGKAS